MKKPFFIIFNPGSAMSLAKKKKEIIEARLNEAQFQYDFHSSKSEAHMLELARNAAKEERSVIAIGGDSTIFQIVNTLASYSFERNSKMKPFGMIGTGSSNDIMKAYEIDTIDKSIRSIENKNIKNVDLVQLSIPGYSPWYYLGQSNIGIGAYVNDYVETRKRQNKKIARYQGIIGAYAIIWAFRRKHIPLKCQIRSDSFNTTDDFTSIVLAKIPYWITGKLFIPGADTSDTFIHGIAIKKLGLFSLLKIIINSTNGAHLPHPKINEFKAKEVLIESKDPFFIQVDGDILKKENKNIMTPRATFKIVSNKLPVFLGER